MKTIRKSGLFLLLYFVVLSCQSKKSNSVGSIEDSKETNYTADHTFDTVILGGRVIDPETELDAIRNLGLVNGKVALITEEKIQGKQSIDATGLVVSPGFIDLHAHGQNISAYRMQAVQGVTTALELESGLLPISDWYETQATKKLPIHYGAAVGWTYARIATFQNNSPEATAAYFQKAQSDNSWKDEIASPEQLSKIMKLVEEGLEQGGLGIGINGGYAPGYGRKEYFELAKLAKKHEVSTYTHVRYSSIPEPQSTFEAFEELLALAALTQARMHICHINSNSLKDIDACLELYEMAKKNGLPVTCGAYPWGAASTVIGAAMFDGADWKERMGYDETAFQVGEKRLDADSFKKIRTEAPGTFVSYHQLDETKAEELAMLDKSITHPDILVESDAMPWYTQEGQAYEGNAWPIPNNLVAHPRSSGTFAKILGSYVRDRKLLTMSDAIRKMSLMPAQTLEDFVPQMKNKGRIQAGMDADIVIFDPKTIAAVGTYAEPYHPAIGVKHLLVMGQTVVSNGELQLDAAPGKPIRR
ncbi:amidohydrolase family protein [Sediminicola luteus]|uniref:D-glutamate deacylase n=1 Tax=Sediminicola luteus TaxID=319238 RepID=A0A2A4G8I2_9FLAO|nr:amidohydrolase family protein [Sediminicola luteus]PCE64072.1 D-glutamate deacylase [Sediminicola luteus]